MPDSYTDMDDTETGYRGGYGPTLTEISKDSNVSIIQLNRVGEWQKNSRMFANIYSRKTTYDVVCKNGDSFEFIDKEECIKPNTYGKVALGTLAIGTIADIGCIMAVCGVFDN